MWAMRLSLVFQHGPPDRSMGYLGPYLILAVLLVAFTLLAIFFVAFPRLGSVRVTEKLQSAVDERDIEAAREETNNEDRGYSKPMEIAIRLLAPDERRVVDSLVKAGGAMLQKDISWELGFSRVKTHRVLVKLLRRGVVTAEKYYNTNRIQLADWLKIDE